MRLLLRFGLSPLPFPFPSLLLSLSPSPFPSHLHFIWQVVTNLSHLPSDPLCLHYLTFVTKFIGFGAQLKMYVGNYQFPFWLPPLPLRPSTAPVAALLPPFSPVLCLHSLFTFSTPCIPHLTHVGPYMSEYSYPMLFLGGVFRSFLFVS